MRNNYRRHYPKAADANPGATTYTIVIEDMTFRPQVLTVRLGDHVTWVNRDLFTHTATQKGAVFDSKEIPSQGSWTWVAGTRGSFAYVCALHPTMSGQLVVR
jgi:plastocyanin